MTRKIAVNSNSYHGFSIEDAIRGIKEAGFRFIELTATKGWTEHVFPDHSFSKLLSVRRELERMDLHPIGMSGHCSLMDPERMKDFAENIQLAAFFGCEFIISSVGEAHLSDKVVSGDDDLVRNLHTIVPLLDKYNLKMAIETHGDHGSGRIISEILKKIDCKRIGLCYDTANVIFYSEVDMIDDLDQSVEAINYIHLKDKAGEKKEWNFPAIGQGAVDFPTVFSILESRRNNSPFSIEIEFTEDGPGNLETVNAAVQQSYQFLKNSGFDI